MAYSRTRFVIRFVRDENKNPIHGFLQSYNPKGKGEVTLTTQTKKAKKFLSRDEAFQYYQNYPIRVFEISIEAIQQ